jgi:3-hydroxyacyl-CoA dehydrogenase / enoyl-CoA hydratase / 3-hydroxybutyryl-CoA epimerase
MNVPLTKSETAGATVTSSSVQGSPATAEHMIRLAVRDDGICVLTFDRPNSSANIFDLRTLGELAEELDFIERQTKIKGVILISAKPSIFIAGLDLNLLRESTSPAEVRALIERGQAVMNRVAALPMPTVAAVHGAAVGGGCEICLACDYRIASPDRATKIGLPETQIGLLPAWGGSTRLPRLIGLPKALEIILGGKTVPAKVALKLGVVDELSPVECLIVAAMRKISKGKPFRPNHWLTNNALVVSVIAPRIHKQLLRKTRGNYPAVLKALEVVVRGISRPVAASLALERDAMLELAQTDACRNLIRVFFMQERAKKRTLPVEVSQTRAKPIARTAVIGAGVMGAGIAQWISARQLPVILRDINTEQVARGMAGIAKLYGDSVKRHTFTTREARDGLDRVSPAPLEVPLHQTDIVVEAAVERLELKKKIFQRLDELVSDNTILATNTSALPISEMAASTRHPERVVGLHFFNPVHRMQLVEVIAARQTAPEILQRALRFAQQIGKLPVVVKDSPGFLVNRILMPYLIEAGNLFETGASIADLDQVMLDFGMPMGPMRLLDEVGLDVSLHVAETLTAKFSGRMKIPDCLRKMSAGGLLGRKSGRGFYLHEKLKEAKPNPQISTYVQSDKARILPGEELQERMVFLMVNEAARCLEEQIVTDPADVDFAMIMGAGFAPFRGGPLRYTDAVGAAKLAGAMSCLTDSGATHFVPCNLLAEMAAKGKKFYPMN